MASCGAAAAVHPPKGWGMPPEVVAPIPAPQLFAVRRFVVAQQFNLSGVDGVNETATAVYRMGQGR
ncbi:hypothetical protein FHX82_006535 [Amycolatopsis bartoniae]|nr:hypothetical protein [Amycolatopsis bartoniae]